MTQRACVRILAEIFRLRTTHDVVWEARICCLDSYAPQVPSFSKQPQSTLSLVSLGEAVCRLVVACPVDSRASPAKQLSIVCASVLSVRVCVFMCIHVCMCTLFGCIYVCRVSVRTLDVALLALQCPPSVFYN